MLQAITSKLWTNGQNLVNRTFSLGMRSKKDTIISEKAEGQFGSNNVETEITILRRPFACVNFNESNGLLLNPGWWQRAVHLLIHWNAVTVTNEKGNSTVIRDLFCKLIFINGQYRSMQFARTTFTQSEWDVRYAHSHLHRFDRSNPTAFSSICTGNGPINDTIGALSSDYPDEMLDLFFWELDKLVHVESLSGIPYISMNEIGKREGARADYILNPVIPNHELNLFCESFLRAVKIPLGFENGQYVLGCTFMEFAIMVTNYFEKYRYKFSTTATRSRIPMNTYVLYKGAIYCSSISERDYSWRRLDTNIHRISFKGHLYPIKVILDNGELHNTRLVELSCVKYIQRIYLALVNMKFCKSQYGKTEEITEKRATQKLHALCTSSGICSEENPYGATTEDTFLYM